MRSKQFQTYILARVRHVVSECALIDFFDCLDLKYFPHKHIFNTAIAFVPEMQTPSEMIQHQMKIFPNDDHGRILLYPILTHIHLSSRNLTLHKNSVF